MRQRFFSVGLLVMLLVPFGCSSQISVVPVTGTVEYNGEPVVGAAVTFVPEEGKSASGITDSSGKFTLTTNEDGDGAIPGNHTVTVLALAAPMPSDDEEGSVEVNEVMEPMEDDDGEITESTVIPQKYADPSTSGLTATIEPSGDNDIKLTLE